MAKYVEAVSEDLEWTVEENEFLPTVSYLSIPLRFPAPHTHTPGCYTHTRFPESSGSVADST